MIVDRALALSDHRLRPLRSVPFDGAVRFALVTVNFSTTAELKLMLSTLIQQDELDRVSRIVIVDNGSRDGGVEFLRRLAASVDRVDLVRNRTRLNHARGLRTGLRHLDRRTAPTGTEPNVVLFCDTDVIFRRPDALGQLARLFEEDGAVLAGEMRGDPKTSPNIQASFVAIRRDVLARRDVAPPLYSGSPLEWQQATIARFGLAVAHFASNADGFVLHRGRSGVAAAARYRRYHHYATVDRRAPHYMDVADGEQIWADAERRAVSRFGAQLDESLIDAVKGSYSGSGGEKTRNGRIKPKPV